MALPLPRTFGFSRYNRTSNTKHNCIYDGTRRNQHAAAAAAAITIIAPTCTHFQLVNWNVWLTATKKNMAVIHVFDGIFFSCCFCAQSFISISFMQRRIDFHCCGWNFCDLAKMEIFSFFFFLLSRHNLFIRLLPHVHIWFVWIGWREEQGVGKEWKCIWRKT